MGDIIKIILIAIVVAVAVTAILIFAMPDLRKGVLAKMKGEKTEQVLTEKEKQIQGETEEKSRIISLLKEKEEDLKVREETISKQESRITELKGEVESLKSVVESYQVNIEKYVVTIDESQKKNIKKLADVFSKMNAGYASEIIANLNDKTTVSILASMKDRSSAKLLGTYSALGDEQAQRAARLSEMLKKVVNK